MKQILKLMRACIDSCRISTGLLIVFISCWSQLSVAEGFDIAGHEDKLTDQTIIAAGNIRKRQIFIDY